MTTPLVNVYRSLSGRVRSGHGEHEYVYGKRDRRVVPYQNEGDVDFRLRGNVVNSDRGWQVERLSKQ